MDPDRDLPATEDLRRLVDDFLDTFLKEKAEEVPAGDERRLVDEIRRLVGSGGKRLRPAFCYWGYRAGGGIDVDSIVRVAAGLELLHTFAIVHDDVMDASARRRGSPTVHRRFAGEVPAGRGDAERFGASAAILVGDLAFVLADEAFFASGFAPDALARAGVWFTSMRKEVISGQFLDVLAATMGGASAAAARRIAGLKSGGYTVEKPLLIGASLAGAGEDVRARLRDYGAPLGVAFQLRDDVLGAFGDPGITGKDADGDILEGKQTVLVALARERASGADRAFIDDRLGRRDLGPSEIERLRALLVSTGALDETNRLIAELTEHALSVAGTFEAELAGAFTDLALAASVRSA